MRAWLAGERVEAPDGQEEERPEGRGPELTLGGREHRRPDLYAIAASEATNWTHARNLTLRDALRSWLEARVVETRILSEVRRIVADADLDGDARHALSMMAINPDLPLAIEGEIVTPAWLLADPYRCYDLVVGPVSRSLDRMGREPCEGRAFAAVPQPDAVRPCLSARDAGDGIRCARQGLRVLQGRLYARHLRQHENCGRHDLCRPRTGL